MIDFNRDLLPDPLTYFEKQGLQLHGRTKWRTGCCVFHGGSDSMRFNTETGGYVCMAGCGAKGGDVLAYHMQAHGLSFVDAARELGALLGDDTVPPKRQQQIAQVALSAPHVEHETLSDYGHELLHACRPIHGTARSYLERRHCVIPPEGGDLLCHPNLRHFPSGYTGPALVAIVTDALTGEPISLHRTWVKPDGSKADVDPPRMLLGGHRKQGGVIRLWSDDYLTHGLAIAEGIETALSLAHAYQPVWAAIDAGNLGALPALPGIETLLIARDNDPAGIRGAAECMRRWAIAGREVLLTTQAQNDMNDVLMEVAQ